MSGQQTLEMPKRRATPIKADDGDLPPAEDSSRFTVRCGGCGAEVEWPIDRRIRHRLLRCPECRRRVRLPIAQRAACQDCGKVNSRRLPPPEPSFECVQCGRELDAALPLASAAGKRRRRSASRHQRDAVGALVTTVLILGFVLLCAVAWLF